MSVSPVILPHVHFKHQPSAYLDLELESAKHLHPNLACNSLMEPILITVNTSILKPHTSALVPVMDIRLIIPQPTIHHSSLLLLPHSIYLEIKLHNLHQDHPCPVQNVTAVARLLHLLLLLSL
jgi:hypothetical protein